MPQWRKFSYKKILSWLLLSSIFALQILPTAFAADDALPSDKTTVTADHIASADGDELGNLSSSDLANIPAGAFSSLNASKVLSIDSDSWSGIDESRLGNLSNSALGALTPDMIRTMPVDALTPTKAAQLSDLAIKGIDKEKMKDLLDEGFDPTTFSAEQRRAFNSESIRGFEETDIDSHWDWIKDSDDFEPHQVAGLDVLALKKAEEKAQAEIGDDAYTPVKYPEVSGLNIEDYNGNDIEGTDGATSSERFLMLEAEDETTGQPLFGFSADMDNPATEDLDLHAEMCGTEGSSGVIAYAAEKGTSTERPFLKVLYVPIEYNPSPGVGEDRVYIWDNEQSCSNLVSSGADNTFLLSDIIAGEATLNEQALRAYYGSPIAINGPTGGLTASVYDYGAPTYYGDPTSYGDPTYYTAYSYNNNPAVALASAIIQPVVSIGLPKVTLASGGGPSIGDQLLQLPDHSATITVAVHVLNSGGGGGGGGGGPEFSHYMYALTLMLCLGLAYRSSPKQMGLRAS